MGAVTIQQMADRVSELLASRLRAKGDTLAARLKYAGPKLPRKVRAAGDRLADAAEKSHHPKLLLQLDEEAIAADYDICLKHLGPMGQAHRRRGVLLGLTSSVAFSLLAVAALVLGVLVWRGFL